MSQCKLTAQEFIQNAFSPVVAVMCSPSVESACRKNNLSFIELLQPFCKLNAEAQLRDPTGGTVALRNFRVTLMDVNCRPPQPTLARKLLNASVTITNDYYVHETSVGDTKIATPWFESWRDIFLQVQYPSDHEFTKHFLACIIVVTSNETNQNPLDTIQHMVQNLNQLQTATTQQSKLPKWFVANGNVLRYFVVLHDSLQGNNDHAVKTMEALKQSYGANNCFLLQMNSRPPGALNDQFLPDPWCQYLMRKPENIEVLDTESPHSTSSGIADMNSVTSMPNNVTTVSLTGENKLEIGQEANEMSTSTVTFHPLSPEVENRVLTSGNHDLDYSFTPLSSDQTMWQQQQDTTFSSPSVIHGACLTTDDIEQLKLFIHEFCLKSLLPYVERQIQQLTDLISNKKGVSRSLFTATKRWFTPNKPGSGQAQAINAVVYATDSPELQLRRLGDLYFMFGHYSMAFQVYHSVKRDFNVDQAWMYYAGALEMAAVSAFMCGEQTRKTCEYIEESIVTYLYTCRMPQFATRATLLSTECLKAKGQFGEAAHQFIRMTSEDSDLRSALLLEQAAYCFLNCTKPRMIRKYAFHIVLAGHRFSKCLQRKHSLRCYRQAFQIYDGKGWSLAEGHIYFTIGKQSSNLKYLEEATNAFEKLLTPASKQSAQQQMIFFKEYLNAYQQQQQTITDTDTMILLPLPILISDETKVLLMPQLPLSTPGRVPASGLTFDVDINDTIYNKWLRLEELIVQKMNGSQPMVFKPYVTFFSTTNSGINAKPIAIVGEPVQVSIALQNALKIVLTLTDLYLLWRFTDSKTGKTIRNESAVKDKYSDLIRTRCVPKVHLAPNSQEEFVLSLTPLTVGELCIEAVCYTINSDNSSITGKQLFDIPEKDKRLEITIAPSAPSLQVSFSEIHQELLCNELQSITVEFCNSGSTPLHNIMMSSSLPHLISLANSNSTVNNSQVIPITLPPHYNGRMEPGQTHAITLWLRAPPTKGTSDIDLLFYFENVNVNAIPRYRLVRHVWHLSVQESLDIEITTQHSSSINRTETLTLSLRATNRNQVHYAVISKITLLRTGLISSSWTFTKQAVIPKDVKLHSQESIDLLLKARRLRHSGKSSKYSEQSISSSKYFTKDIMEQCVNFAKKSLLIMETESKSNQSCNKMDAMLILNWYAVVTDSAGSKRTVIGQHYVSITMLNNKQSSRKLSLKPPSHTSLNENNSNLASLQKQIMCNLSHTPVLTHDFTVRNICIVPVQLTLHSSASTDLIVKVNTHSTLDLSMQRSEYFNVITSHDFRWIGHSEYVCSMKPFSSHRLKLHVAIVAPGTYDVGGRIEIMSLPPNQPYDPIMQNCRLHSPLIVKSASVTAPEH